MMCIVWFCGDREELVIQSKMEAENKMIGDGKKTKQNKIKIKREGNLLSFPGREED